MTSVSQPPEYPGKEPAPDYTPPVSQGPYGPSGNVAGSINPGQQAFQYHPSTAGHAPFQSQPAAQPPVIWMPAPPVPPKCPPGLEYLTQVEQITVEQEIDLVEISSGFETCNRYEVKNSLGQRMYYAVEENDDFTLNCYGALRQFTVKLFDSAGQPVIQLSREFQCSMCCCPCICCLQELEVQAPLGTVIGYVKQKWHPCLPKFVLQNEARENILTMSGPCVPCRCYADINFEVKTTDGSATIGVITKKWLGLAREAVSASNFGIQLPLDLDVKMKAIVLGASILLDFMFFERRQQRRRQR